MRIRNRIAATVISAAMLASIAACGAGADSSKTTLTYFGWHPETAMAPIIKAFEAANPDIKIDMGIANGAANDYAQTLTTRIAGNQTPDVFHMSIETRSAIMDGGYALDLTDEPFMEGVDSTATELYTQDGRTYGMSLTAWIGAVIYNKDALESVGYDAVPTDLDGFTALGEALAGAGWMPYMEDTSVVSGSFSAMLGGYYSAQGISPADDPVFTGKQTFDEVYTPLLEQWQQIVSSGTMPATAVGVTIDQITQSFLTGDLAMYRSGPWDFSKISEAGINFGVAPFPALDGGEPYVGGGPDSPFAISSKLEGDKLEAAKKFLAFMNTAETLEMFNEQLDQISTSTAYDSVVAPELEVVYNDYLKTGKYFWINWPSGGTVMGQEIASQWQLLIQDQATASDVAQALDRKWSTVS